MNPFREALEGWTEDQWIQGELQHGDGYCAVGRAAHVGHVPWEHLFVLDHVATEMFPDRVGWTCTSAVRPAAQFNDHEDTEFADVQQVLEKAAVRWDEQQ